jgi:hypothetical protein
MSTDGPTPPPADTNIYENGECVMVTSTIGSNAIEKWVKRVAKRSGQPVDWHWFGGRALILALGDISRVKSTIVAMMPEHDRLYTDAVRKLSPDMVDVLHPPRPNWFEEYQQGN